MELAGDEKKIQAWFLELKKEDGHSAPGFARLWKRALAINEKPRRTLRTAFAVATALLVITLCALAFWSRNWHRGQEQNSEATSRSTMPGSTSVPSQATPEPKHLVVNEAGNRIRVNRGQLSLAARGQAEFTSRNAIIRNAVAISTWQSPTTTLMQSPGDDVLTSLPQLDQSATEFRSFLPNTKK
jgi:hypothetical protein